MMNKFRRRLSFEVFRYDPLNPLESARIDTFELDETPYMSLYIALNLLREDQDPSLQFDFSCRSAVCGSCGMMVNGRPALACKTLTAALPRRIRLHPLPGFELIGDLSVDTGTWFRQMGQRLEAWIHESAPFVPDQPETRMDDERAQTIYERDRCIECGCCVAACGIASIRPDFLTAAGLNRMARFLLDPRDARAASDCFDVIATPDGVFGCVGLMACEDICPKGLPLQDVSAYLRRQVLKTALMRK